MRAGGGLAYLALASCGALCSAGQPNGTEPAPAPVSFCALLECDFAAGLCAAYRSYGAPAVAASGRDEADMRRYYEAVDGSTGGAEPAAEGDEPAAAVGGPSDALLRSFVRTETAHYDWKGNEHIGAHMAAELLPYEAAYMEIKLARPLPADVYLSMRVYRSSTRVRLLYCCDERCAALKPRRGGWSAQMRRCHGGAQLISLACANGGGAAARRCGVDNVRVRAGIDCGGEEAEEVEGEAEEEKEVEEMDSD